MTELIFIEGVSGVGKSTMVRMLTEELRARGYAARDYLEFDHTNPIDFYCTACLGIDEYAQLLAQHPAEADTMRAYTIDAGEVRLVRYYAGDDPLYSGSLLDALAEREFCWKPRHPVTLAAYTAIYREVWRNFAASLDGAYEFILFDGSLLHHPINDMMRNYAVTGEQAAAHVRTLLEALGGIRRRIFYLHTEDIVAQLGRAHRDRGQNPPTAEEIAFWEARHRNDRIVLDMLRENTRSFNVSNEGWDAAREAILRALRGQ